MIIAGILFILLVNAALTVAVVAVSAFIAAGGAALLVPP
jgi:hypothetical protein